jgi:hypothetical protein
MLFPNDGMATHRVLDFFSFATIVLCASAPTETMPPDLKAILAGMAQARAEGRSHLRPYLVTRDYRLRGKDAIETRVQRHKR